MYDLDKALFGKEKNVQKKEKKEKKPKEYTHPIMRSMHGQNLKVEFRMRDDGFYDTYEYWVPMSGASLKAQGYIPAVDYKRDFRNILTHVYVKFTGFEMYPCLRVNARGSLEEVQTLETASTLHDYFMSDAEQEFVSDLRSKTLSSMGSKQLTLFALIGIGVLGLVWFLMRGGI